MRVIGIDLGHARTGLAICDNTGFLASPAGVIFERKDEKLLEKTENENQTLNNSIKEKEDYIIEIENKINLQKENIEEDLSFLSRNRIKQ